MSKMGSLRAPIASSPPSRENAGMSTIIRDVFQASQDSIACHPKLVKKLRNCYDSANDPDKFFDTFIRYLRYPISGVTERTAFIDRTLDFCAKFACCFIENREEKANGEATDKEKDGEGAEDPEDEEEELPLFTYRLFTWLLDHHEANGSDTRLRVCQLLNKLLKYMGEEACIDDDLYNKIYDGMLERLKDKVAEIRSQAVTALQRLQDPRDEECPIIKAYLFHLAHDPNNIVRRMIVRCIGATRVTLPHILERTRDTDEHVRRAAYKFLADKVHIKSLTIGQREGVLQRGLGDRSEAVRHICEKEMIPAWLRLSGNNIVQLLHHLDVGNSDQDFGPKKIQPACVGALQVLFADVAYRDLVANFQYLDEQKLIPFEKLTAETALYWRCLVKFMDDLPEIDKEDLVENLLPELTGFCDYLRRYVLELEKGDEDMHWEFVAIELIRMTKSFDIGDEVGRRNLVKLVKDLLSSSKTPISFVPHLVEVFARVEENTQSRIDQIAEIISELKDPICDEVEMSPGAVTVGEPGSVMREPGSVQPTPASIQPTPARPETLSEEERQQKRIEIAKLRVQINVKKDELDAAVGEHDFSAAQLIKIQLDALDEAAMTLQMQLASSGEAPTPHNPTPATGNPLGPTPATVLITPATGANVNTGATLDLSDEVHEGQDKPAVVLKCLKLIVSTLQDPKIQVVNATLQTLMEEFIVKSVQSEIDYIRKEAINALTCVCLRSIDLSRDNLLLLVHAAHIDVMDVRIAAVTALVDLLMKHGLVAFITNTTPEPQNEIDSSETASKADSNIESALDSDMAMRGATLTQSELENQGGNSVVAILSKLLDEPDIELRTEVAEGLCKLLMIGAISSPKLLSRLILIWYNPMTESDSKLRHILGTFFPLYCSMSRGHQEALRQAFLPTMKVLFDAPVTSPMSEIDSEDVGMFIIHLTSENCLQSFDKDKKEEASVEDTSNTTVHDELVFPICNEILSAPDAFQCKVLIKHLTSLQLTPNNYTNLRSIKSLSEQLLGKVKERSCVRQLEKFDKTVQGWLANDASAACLNVESEKKRPQENEETVSAGSVTGSPVTDETPRKKKKLFSQTLHGQTLLHPEDVENVSSASDGDDGVFTNTSQGVIPSPVVNANKTGSPTAKVDGIEPLNSSRGEKEKGSNEELLAEEAMVKKKASFADKEIDEEVTISGNYFSDIITAKPGKDKTDKSKGSLSAADLTGIQDVFQSTQVGSNISVGRTSADEDTEDEDKSENETLVEDKDQEDNGNADASEGDSLELADKGQPKKKGKKKVAPVTVIPPSDEDEDPIEDVKEAKKKGKKKKASALEVIPLSDEEDEINKDDDMFSDTSSVTSVVSVASRLPSDNILDDSSTEEEDSIFAKNESPEGTKKKPLGKGKKAATTNAKGKKADPKKNDDNEDIEETPIIVNKNLSMRRAGRRGETNTSQGSESASDRSSAGASPVVRRRKVEETPLSTNSSRKVEETPLSTNSSRSSRSSRTSKGSSPVTEKKAKPAAKSTKADTSASKANTSASKADTSATSRRSTRKSRTPSQSPTPSTRSTRNSPVPPEPKPTAAQKKKKADPKTKDVPEETPKPGRKRASPRTAEPSSPATQSPATKKKAIVNLNVNGSSKKAEEAVRKAPGRLKKMGSVASNSSDDFVPSTPQVAKGTSGGAKTNTSRTSGRKK